MSGAIDTTTTLNNGVEMPLLGLGVFKVPNGQKTISVCQEAFAAGYRHIDTAMIYGNERDVGTAIKASGLAREDIFVTTKLWNTDHGYQEALSAGRESLNRMGLDHIDLYLVHWPLEGRRLETWKAMEQMLDEGLTRSIGVSNYMPRHLDELLAVCQHRPAVNQIELHPFNYGYRLALIDLCRQHDIQVEAYSPLTRGKKFDDPRLAQLAAAYSKTPAQILIRWALDHEFAVIPKSLRAERIRENAAVFDFSMEASDKAWLDDFNEDLIVCWDPTDVP